MMKLLALLFLVGYAAASASFYDVLDQAADEIVFDFMVGMDRASSLKRSLDFEGDEEYDIALANAEEDIKTELGKKLRDALDKLLEKVKDAIEQGKTVKGDVLEKLKELKQKMKDLKIDVGEKAKDLLDKIKDKAKDFLKKILDQLDLGDAVAYSDFALAEEDIKTELGKKLRDALDKLLEKVKDAIEQGKTVKGDVLEKLKELKQKMKDLKIDVGEKAKDLLGKIKEKAKDFLKKILDQLDLGDKDESFVYSDIAFADEDIKTELGKKLRDALDKLLEKVKDAIEQGKTVKGDVLEKLKELKQKMKDLKIDVGEKAKDLLGKIKEKAKDFLKKILDQLDLGDKDETVAYADFNIKNIFKKLKKAILGQIAKDELKNKIEQLFGKGSELADQLLALLKEKGEKGKNKILELIDRVLGEDEEKQFSDERRSIKDMWEKVKDYFKDLNIDLKEKFAKFGEWVKDTVKKGLDKGKTKIENIKAIAKEFHKNAKDVSKEIAVEALEFLRPYKDDLGTLWDQVKDSVKEILNRKEY